MMAKSKSVKRLLATPPTPRAAHELTLGVDGGGTKTRAVIIDAGKKVLGEGLAGASNPLRVGIALATNTIREAIDRACAAARVRRTEIVAAEIGLAGVRRADLRERMRDELRKLHIRTLDVVTDADIALFGVADGQPGIIIIAGTGSICCGRNARGTHVCAGGWGPLAGDEGSGSWIARRGLQAVAKAADGRAPKTPLVKAACNYFNVTKPDDLATAIYAPNMTHGRIAGFARQVIEAARKRDAVSREIVCEAGRELGQAAKAVISSLRMGRESFLIGYVGGVFTAGELVLAPLRQEIAQVAPKAHLTPPLYAPAEAAARMARERLPWALAS